MLNKPGRPTIIIKKNNTIIIRPGKQALFLAFPAAFSVAKAMPKAKPLIE
jgi:hypothetical protein